MNLRNRTIMLEDLYLMFRNAIVLYYRDASQEHLQVILDNVEELAISYKLEFSVDKCAPMVFSGINNRISAPFSTQ